MQRYQGATYFRACSISLGLSPASAMCHLQSLKRRVSMLVREAVFGHVLPLRKFMRSGCHFEFNRHIRAEHAFLAVIGIFTRRAKMNSFFTSLWNSRTKKLRVVIAITAFIIGVWIIFFPRPYYWVVGAGFLFMPVLMCVSLIDRDGFEFKEPKKSDVSRVNLVGPFIFVLCALMLRGAADIQIADDFEVAKLAIPTGLSIALIGWIILKRADFLLLLLFSLVYSLPLVMELNNWGPAKSEFVVIGSVERKYASGKPLNQTIVIRSNYEEIHLHVSRDAYRSYRIGDTACAKRQKGWLGLVILFPIRCP